MARIYVTSTAELSATEVKRVEKLFSAKHKGESVEFVDRKSVV